MRQRVHPSLDPRPLRQWFFFLKPELPCIRRRPISMTSANPSAISTRRVTRVASALTRLFPKGVAIAELHGGGAQRLHPEELRALGQATAARQRDFAAGRACARSALAQLGAGTGAIPVNDDRSPRWPYGAVGSITHTHGYAAAAAAIATEFSALGLDAELQTRFDEPLLLSICTPAELNWLAARAADQRDRWATLLFCAKEAFYKCQSPLTHRWLEMTEVSIEVAGDHLRVAAAPHGLTQIGWQGRHALDGDRVLAGFWLPASH